jgi:hypothetical protein
MDMVKAGRFDCWYIIDIIDRILERISLIKEVLSLMFDINLFTNENYLV